MTSNEILQADMLDILFDNRNKQYGAYTLRRYYKNRLMLALGMTLSFTVLLFLFIHPNNNNETMLAKPDIFILKQIDIPRAQIPKPEIPKPPKQNQIQAAVAKKIFVSNIKMVAKNILTEQMPQISELDKANISIISAPGIEGKELPKTINIAGDKNTGNEKKALQEIPVAKEPQFPGGMQAWLNFLNKNLKVPDELEAGEKKTVLIRFKVATDGSVTGFEVMQSGGNVYDNEVIRVLKKMPKWKPAIQNGQPVSTSFTQPVSFMGLEE